MIIVYHILKSMTLFCHIIKLLLNMQWIYGLNDLRLSVWHDSLLYVETADRPGLLRDIVKVVNIVFESGEFDTEV